MTEEQKARFCDEYCKYRDRADKVIKASEKNTDNEILTCIGEGAEKILSEICDICPINSIKNTGDNIE